MHVALWAIESTFLSGHGTSAMTGWFGSFALSLTRHYSSDASHDREGVVFRKRISVAIRRADRLLLWANPRGPFGDARSLALVGYNPFGDRYQLLL